MTSLPVGRPRSAGRLDLPDNLTPHPRQTKDGETVVYYYWRDPRDGLPKSLKCPNDKVTAIRRAKELNALVANETAEQFIRKISAPAAKQDKAEAPDTPFDVFAVHYLLSIQKRGLADNTLRSRKSLVNAAIRWFKDTPMQDIRVTDCVSLLKEYTDQKKNRTAQAIRSALIDMWNEAKHEGLLPAGHTNPAAITRNPAAKVNRARLTLDDFNTIFEASSALADYRGVWIPNSMLLALVTGQRREDLVRAQFRRGKDWNGLWDAYQQDRSATPPYPCIDDGYFWVIQKKTGALVKIPLALRMDAIGFTVGDVVDRCRSIVASRYLLHHTVPFGNAPLGSVVSIDRVSHAFADARNKTDLAWPGKTPPSYHEIRSLAERLYRAQGIDTQALLGHRHARMTEIYADARQAEWTTVAV